ncbi:MAG: hypothetical protein JNM24_04750 [Bdellovibrionaceae bacterium]|nr:hypothetical protein [Pseudobdellovibrionaceae bacterium]
MNFAWLAQEAKTIHYIFANMFYIVVATLLMLGVLLEYFKLPLGGIPQAPILVGRAIIACLILAALPEIMNTLSDITDAVSAEIGDLNNFKLVLSRMGDKLGELSWSWVSFKESVILLISFLTFFVLYITVHLADSLYLYTWMLLYIMAPILIALFVLPATASATKGLFRSLFEVCSWKIMWSVLSALLWSFALSDINKPETEVSFLSVIVLNLMLAFSILMTPMISRLLFNAGIANAAAQMGGMILRAATLTPTQLLTGGKAALLTKRSSSNKRHASASRNSQSAQSDDEDPSPSKT